MTTFTASNTLDRLIEAGFPIDPGLRYDPAEIEVECEFEIDSWGSTGNGWDDPGEAAEFHLVATHVTAKHFEPQIWFVQKHNEWLENHFSEEIQLKCAEYDGGGDYDG